MLDVKVKGVNMGRTKKEGWRRKKAGRSGRAAWLLA